MSSIDVVHGIDDSIFIKEAGISIREHLLIGHSGPLMGEVHLEGAKNATLVIIASLLLTDGVSRLKRVPPSADVFQMKHILELLGAHIIFDEQLREMVVDTRSLRDDVELPAEVMSKFRASTLVLGPLLARFGRAVIAFPGGDAIGKRPINYHFRAFQKMGAVIAVEAGKIFATVPGGLSAEVIVLEYPSVGATENILMAAALLEGKTTIINAALEPEIFDLMTVLRQMGASIVCEVPGIIHITGVKRAASVEHTIMPDRLEAGTYMIAAAITKGTMRIPEAPVQHMAVFIEALRSMGHMIEVDQHALTIHGADFPKAVSFRTMPHPGFPTDLQAPMLVAQTMAEGTSFVHETVYESRLGYVRELQRLGAQIVLSCDMLAVVQGGGVLHGAPIIAGDIRAAAALTLAGLVAQGSTKLFGVEHIHRGYVDFVPKLQKLGACIQERSA